MFKNRRNISFSVFMRRIRVVFCFPAHIIFHIFHILGICAGPLAFFIWIFYLGYFMILNITGKAWISISGQFGSMLGLGIILCVLASGVSLIAGIICNATYSASKLYMEDVVWLKRNTQMRFSDKKDFKQLI